MIDAITPFVLAKLDDIGVANMCFHKDDVTCHMVNETIHLQNWPPNKPLDFSSKVYVNKSITIHALQEEIKRGIKEIQPQLCRTVMKNFDKVLHMCQQSRGGHLPDLLFHKNHMLCKGISSPVKME